MNTAYSIIYAVLKILLTPLFPMRYIGRENIPEGAAVICANHSDCIDPILVAFALKCKTFPKFMAKIEISRVPVLGAVLRSAGVFFVDRKGTDINAVRTSMRHLKSGEKIMIFPEGTRVSDGESIEAKRGAIRLAAKMKAPILPILIPRKKKLFRRGTVVIGEPYMIDGSKREDYDELSAQLMDKIYCLSAANELDQPEDL